MERMKRRFWAVLLIVWGGSAIFAFPFGNRRYSVYTYSITQLLGTLLGAVLLIVGVSLLVSRFRR